jgi:hypothetical protein
LLLYVHSEKALVISRTNHIRECLPKSKNPPRHSAGGSSWGRNPCFGI